MKESIVMSVGAFFCFAESKEAEADKLKELFKGCTGDDGNQSLLGELHEDSWIIQLAAAEKADELADQLLKKCAEHSRSCAEGSQYRLLIGVDGGSMY